MSSAHLLSDAVRALRDKIAVSSTTATPEELAYLGSAIEKIGGRASLLEVLDATETAKAEALEAISARRSGILSDVSAARDTAVAAVGTVRQTQVFEAGVDISRQRADAVAAVDAAVLQMRAERADALALVEQAASNAVAELEQAQADAQSLAATLVAQQNLSRVRLFFYRMM